MKGSEITLIEKEGDFNTFVKHLFENPPQPLNSIQIGNLQFDSEEDILKFLLALFCEGVKILFGIEKIEWKNVSKEDLQTVNKYFNSFGWELLIEKNNKKVAFTGKNLETNKILDEFITIKLFN